ncbi:hypothetical protein G6F60_014945 [Rhizopus arrhizus]|nr:hypothetical protein G6F60_014945 [Rhizopus arrhizus]
MPDQTSTALIDPTLADAAAGPVVWAAQLRLHGPVADRRWPPALAAAGGSCGLDTALTAPRTGERGAVRWLEPVLQCRGLPGPARHATHSSAQRASEGCDGACAAMAPPTTGCCANATGRCDRR